MRALLQSIFSVSAYKTPSERDRARLLFDALVSVVLLYSVYLTISVRPDDGKNLWQIAFTDPSWMVRIGSVFFFGVLTFLLVRFGKQKFGSISFLALLYIGLILSFAYRDAFRVSGDGVLVAAFIMIAGFLERERGLIVALVISLLTVVVGMEQPLPTLTTGAVTPARYYTISILLVGTSALVYLFLRYVRQDRQQAVAKIIEDRLKLAQLTTRIAQRVARRTALQAVLTEAVEQIRQNYPKVYHVQIFLIDRETRMATLVAGTGEIGQKLVAQHDAIHVGGKGIIGTVTATGKSMIELVGGSVVRPNDLLSETAAEATFPLRLGDTVIGALDLQSKIVTAFEEDDRPILQSLADSIAIAVENARLYEAEQQRTHEAETLREAGAAVAVTLGQKAAIDYILKQLMRVVPHDRAAVQLLYDGYLEVTGGWPDPQKRLGMRIDIPGDNPNTSVVLERRPVVINDAYSGEYNTLGSGFFSTFRSWLGVPLIVQERVIGMLTLDSRETDYFTPDRIRLALAFADQVAIVLQNAQLFEKSVRYAREMEQARFAAEAANRAKNTFLANMSHELRTPLNAIIGYTSLLCDGTYGPISEKQLDRLRRVMDSGQNLLHIINNLLDLSKLEGDSLDLTIKEFDLTTVIDAAVNAARPLAKANSDTINVDYPLDLGTMVADQAKVQRIVFNLLHNAAKFTSNGQIGLTVKKAHEPEMITFQITDTGVGMTPGQTEHIFDGFSQVDSSPTRRFSGVGLGLAITRYFTLLMGGEITCQSELNRGSTFTVKLPLQVSAPQDLPLPIVESLPHDV